MWLFNKEKCIDIVLKNKNKYVQLAVLDLKNDFKRISEFSLEPEILNEETDWCIVIEENTSSGCDPIKNETFKIKTEGNKIIISADGYLGTMWGIYTFSEKFLGVDPCYLFNDFEIQPKTELEIPEIDISDGPQSFGFRGAFLNDEDLLTGWKEGGGIRYIDYRFYGITLDESVINRVVETMLRLKLNLLIPASFLNIDNPCEKLLADSVARRGIYLTQHHLEPLGVSFASFAVYCKKYGKTGEFSYVENPETMVDAWTFYAEKWAQYDNVVWQIGLRGAKDRPVWEDEIPTEKELADAGDIISKAYQVQKDIVMKVTGGKAKYFSSTLWMEGSTLLEKGHLTFPEDTMIIFADAGPNQMYGKEYYSVPRDRNTKYGIYYHVQYHGCGPHLAPQTGLDKLEYNIRLARDNGDNSYSILNISNVREFVFEIKAYSEMMWNTDAFAKSAYLDKYCQLFGEHSSEVKAVINKYYDNLPEIDTGYLPRHLSQYFNYTDTRPDGVKNFVIKEGMTLSMGDHIVERFHRELDDKLYKEFCDALLIAIPKYKALCEEIEKLQEKLEGNLKKHIEVKWQLYAKTLRNIYIWYVNLYQAKCHCDLRESELMKEKLNIACNSLEEYLSFRKCAEYGEFEHWYRGDLKQNVVGKLIRTKQCLGQHIEWK